MDEHAGGRRGWVHAALAGGVTNGTPDELDSGTGAGCEWKPSIGSTIGIIALAVTPTT